MRAQLEAHQRAFVWLLYIDGFLQHLPVSLLFAMPAEPNIKSISSNSHSTRQDVFPLDQWTITTKKGIILQSQCTCQLDDNKSLCNICLYRQHLPQLHGLPDMVFNDNLLKLEHYTGVGIEFKALDALKLVQEMQDPLRVAVASGWQSARAEFPFAGSIAKPFDWTFTTNYKGTLLTSTKNKRISHNRPRPNLNCDNEPNEIEQPSQPLILEVVETNERIDINKLKSRDEILFYDDITLYEDELADHGSAKYSVKIRVMPKSLFILARFYLRVDGVLARINDTRIYHELKSKHLLREYTNREAKISTLNLPISVLTDANLLMTHLPIIESKYEKLVLS